jgi:hypothetical protein
MQPSKDADKPAQMDNLIKLNDGCQTGSGLSSPTSLLIIATGD